jgi:hypothetical protein
MYVVKTHLIASFISVLHFGQYVLFFFSFWLTVPFFLCVLWKIGVGIYACGCALGWRVEPWKANSTGLYWPVLFQGPFLPVWVWVRVGFYGQWIGGHGGFIGNSGRATLETSYYLITRLARMIEVHRFHVGVYSK